MAERKRPTWTVSSKLRNRTVLETTTAIAAATPTLPCPAKCGEGAERV